MSQREPLLVLAHAHGCSACRKRLLADPMSVTRSRALSEGEKELLTRLKTEDFITPDTLSRATGVTLNQLAEYQNHPVTRLRHF